MQVVQHPRFGTEITQHVFDIPELPRSEKQELNHSLERGLPDRSIGRERWMDCYHANMREVLSRLAERSGIGSLVAGVEKTPLYVDMGGVLWDARQIALVELPYFGRMCARMHATQAVDIIGADLGLHAMLTQLLVSLTLCVELKEFVMARELVVSMGWSDHTKYRPPAIEGKQGRLCLAEDPYPASTLFAIVAKR